MSHQTLVPDCSVEAIIEHIFDRRQISRSDQNLLMSQLLSENLLSELEKRQVIDRLFSALQRGFIKVVD